jgi:hypothetical protein
MKINKWVARLVLTPLCGLAVSASIHARESCDFSDTNEHLQPMVLVRSQVAYQCGEVYFDLNCTITAPTTTTVRLRVEFLDSELGQPAWKFWFKIDNSSSLTKAAKITATINTQQCLKGPYTIGSGGFVASSCTIQPEPSATGLYTVVITTDKDSGLKYNYLLCQKNAVQ